MNSTDVSQFGKATLLRPNFCFADVSDMGRVDRFLVLVGSCGLPS
ncbi:hypothetical protein RISK_005092 [Rhodopirellula islandica]|uniref:Uncharacterized protein n=1 Tax=Rhodopirellula islandica TaxID=595434 RepID=A0A0J1B8L7_RHOIS|nr:hypothetical protein RISK_005092 [Rhodopirellula islandica]